MKNISFHNHTSEDYVQVIPDTVLQGFLISIAITNTTVFAFSIGWLVKIVLETIKLRRMIKSLGLEDTEQREIRLNTQIMFRRNLIMIIVLLVEALHLIIKGAGFAMFFYLAIYNQDKFGFIIDCNNQNSHNIVKGFKYFPVTLARIGMTNSLILFLSILLSIVMVYLSKVYNEHKDLEFLKIYLTFGILQFFIVWISVSVLWTGFEGTIIFSIFVVINCVILFKARKKLSIALLKWRNDGEFYDGMDINSLRRREKTITRSNRWTFVLVLSFTIYLISISLDNFGNWILMIFPNPCLIKTVFGIHISEASLTTSEVALNVTAVLFAISDVGTLQFDLFLIFSTLVYLLTNNCYITTAYQDRIIRANVRNLIEEQHSTINRRDFN